MARYFHVGANLDGFPTLIIRADAGLEWYENIVPTVQSIVNQVAGRKLTFVDIYFLDTLDATTWEVWLAREDGDHRMFHITGKGRFTELARDR